MSWQTLQKKQPAAVRVLTRAIEKDRLAHAYLLEGPRGTGKQTAAALLAKSFFCHHRQNAEPCQECVDCRRIDSGNHPDAIWVHPDGQSIKKNQVEALIKEFAFKGVESNRKIFLIEKAETMTTQAANSLLKFIEEPHAETMAVLLTVKPHLLLKTILSRCQSITFTPLTKGGLEKELISLGITQTKARLATVMTNDRDEAVELCNDEWFAKARMIVLQLMESIQGRSSQTFMIVYEMITPHFDTAERMNIGLDLILYWYRDLLSVHLSSMNDIIYSDEKDKLQDQALHLPVREVLSAIEMVLYAKDQLSANVSQQNVLEQLVLKLQRGSGNDL